MYVLSLSEYMFFFLQELLHTLLHSMLKCHESRKDVLTFLEKAISLNAKRNKLQVCMYVCMPQ